jgi:hypothetical protein
MLVYSSSLGRSRRSPYVLVERPRPVPRRPNRTADMNVQEKSDCAVVPVNQPNKERLLSAEAGEGRAQTKENIVQSHIRPTQSGERMSQGLRGVCDKQQEKGSRNVSPLCFTKITMEARIASPYLNALLPVTRNSPFREKCYPALPINLVCTCSLYSSKPRRLHALRGAFSSRVC